jgi:hypothetical protein
MPFGAGYAHVANMAVYSYINIGLPEAKRLADLSGILDDLTSCLLYCRKYVEGHPLHPDLESYSTTLITKYTRCFSSGVRSEGQRGLEAVAVRVDEETHKFVCGLRDRHLSHSVSDLESHRVRVWLNPEEKGRAVNNVNIESARYIGVGSSLPKLDKLVAELIAWVQAEMRMEEGRLKEIVQQRYTLDQLYTMNAEPFGKVDYGNLMSGKARKGP